MSDKKKLYCMVILLSTLTLLSGCSTDTNPAWDLDVRGNLNEAGEEYLFSGTVYREGAINVGETHTVSGIKLEFLDSSRNEIKTVKIGEMGLNSERKINIDLPDVPHYVLLKYDSATSAPDAGSVSGLQIVTDQNNISYVYYGNYDPQYKLIALQG